VDWTYPTVLSDIPTETGHIQSKAGHVRWTVFSPTFVHCFGHSLLLIPFFFCHVRNFDGIIYMMFLGVFITFLQGFGFGV
jgi:hypothetical protein